MAVTIAAERGEALLAELADNPTASASSAMRITSTSGSRSSRGSNSNASS
ncbi:hypothetical protein [Natrialba asiatica]|nr:hypothetical protein [Natrialba asiatica]